jgi:hypothetical protein
LFRRGDSVFTTKRRFPTPLECHGFDGIYAAE